MAHEEVIQLSAINVVLHPHPEGVYAGLLKAVRRARLIAPIHGDRHGMMTQLWELSADSPIQGFSGVISTFVKLDSDLPWFNTETSDAATDMDMAAIDLPDNLQPNYKRCYFVFDVRRHIFIFSSDSRKGGVTAKLMIKFLRYVFHHHSIEQRFGIARLTVIPDSTAVGEILSWRQLNKLLIYAERPNVGDYDEEEYAEIEREIDEDLREQNADAVTKELKAASGHTLQPNESTKRLATVASVNGYVEGVGKDEGGRSVVRSTKDNKPLIVKDSYDNDREVYEVAFLRVASFVEQRMRAVRGMLRRQ